MRLRGEFAGCDVLDEPATEVPASGADIEIRGSSVGRDLEAVVSGRDEQPARRAEGVRRLDLQALQMVARLLVEIGVEQHLTLARHHSARTPLLSNADPGARRVVSDRHGRSLLMATAVERVSSSTPASSPNGT